MRVWLIQKLFKTLDPWAKWEAYHSLACPSIDAVLAEQANQAAKLFRG